METWDQHERDLAAETIFRFVFRSLYRLKAFNGDPHPGNYLFRGEGRVSFLDFGLVKHFAQDEIATLQELARTTVLERDPDAARRVVEQAGFFRPGAPVSTDQIFEYVEPFYEFVLRDEDVKFTNAYASDIARRSLFGRVSHPEVIKWGNLPPSFVILQRINLGLYAILGRVEATANWRRIAEEMWPMTDRPPSTTLGREEASWWETRRSLAASTPNRDR